MCLVSKIGRGGHTVRAKKSPVVKLAGEAVDVAASIFSAEQVTSERARAAIGAGISYSHGKDLRQSFGFQADNSN